MAQLSRLGVLRPKIDQQEKCQKFFANKIRILVFSSGPGGVEPPHIRQDFDIFTGGN
jgi:hypothetical protein